MPFEPPPHFIYMQAIQSKTVLGLLVLLGVTVGLALVGKLTPEVVEVVKWIGGTYMAVRVTANATENFKK